MSEEETTLKRSYSFVYRPHVDDEKLQKRKREMFEFARKIDKENSDVTVLSMDQKKELYTILKDPES